MPPPGECARLVESLDWAGTSLGPVERWSAALRATVADILHSRQPMLLFWGPDLIQIYNDAFVPSFGRGKHPEAMGQRARECWSDAWPVVGAQIEAVMSRGEPAWFADTLVPIHRNGRMEEVFWTYGYSPAFDGDGRIAGTLVIVTETTGQVLAMRRLDALAGLGAAIAHATDRDAVFAALRQLAATHPGDLPLLTLDDHRDDRVPELGEVVLATPLGAGPWPEPIERAFVAELPPAGPSQRLTISFGLSPRLPFDGGYRSFLVQLVEQLGAALRRIRASQAKDEFLAMLGHELRNPLAPIASAIELMKQKDTATVREQEMIERQLRHVTRLVDDLLDVSRITRGTVELQRRPIELGAVVARAIESTRHLIEQRDHRLTVDVRDGLFVDGDEARLTQVVSNLLSNAARYTPPGGQVRVVAGVVDGDAVLRVIDSGIGMDTDLLGHVFELFVQGRRGADRAGSGLGIGLAVVKNLVTLHGGTVSARSAGRDAGSELTVTLPTCPPPASTADDTPAALPMARSAKRVMIVDDNEDAAMLLGELVRSCGHQVAIVHDPEAALRVIGEFEPHVAVLDIGLPGMDGYELATRIHERQRRCRLIALTGYGQDKDRELALQAGFEAHFVKPVALNAFLNLIA